MASPQTPSSRRPRKVVVETPPDDKAEVLSDEDKEVKSPVSPPPPPRTPRKKPRKGVKFIDDDCVESTPSKKKKTKKKAEKKEKISHAERKKMADFRKELPALLKALHSDLDTHYQVPSLDILKHYAEAIKWAWKPQHDAKVSMQVHEGWSLFWEWWSLPMKSSVNKVFEEEFGRLQFEDAKEKVAEKIEEYKEEWATAWTEAIPKQSAVEYCKNWVRHVLGNKEVTLNPQATDAEIARLSIKYNKDVFVLFDEHGVSAAWEEKEKLWAIRKQKERSAIAMGQGLVDLLGTKIIFTEEKLLQKFQTYVKTASCMCSALNWLKGSIPVFPSPMKEKMDSPRWSIAIKGGQVVDFSTFRVRTRTSADLFSMETRFRWLTDHKSPDGTIIMDSTLVEQFRASVKAEKMGETMRLVSKLVPNAWRFTQGPFRDLDRHCFMLFNLGLLLTTHCNRKALWIFGDGRGMKSTLFSAITKCLEPFAVPLSKKVFFASGSEASHQTDLMRAENKRMVYIDELEKRDCLKETIYKLFVAHQKISAREIFGGQGEWIPRGTLCCITNTVPPMQFTDCSIPDRILAIRATTRVFSSTGTRQELPPHWENEATWEDGFHEETGIFWVLKRMEDVLWAEKFTKDEEDGGFMNELGCLLLLCAHLAYVLINRPDGSGEIPMPPIVKQDQIDFMKEADAVSQFLTECTVETTEEDEFCLFKAIYESYVQWTKEQGVKSQLEQKSFRASLRAKSLLVRKRVGFGKYKTGTQDAVKVVLRDRLMDDDPRRFE